MKKSPGYLDYGVEFSRGQASADEKLARVGVVQAPFVFCLFVFQESANFVVVFKFNVNSTAGNKVGKLAKRCDFTNLFQT